MVAAGGADFQIERQNNKVFVKPLKPRGLHQPVRLDCIPPVNYELEPAGEVKDMNFAIDNPVKIAPAERRIPWSGIQWRKLETISSDGVVRVPKAELESYKSFDERLSFTKGLPMRIEFQANDDFFP